MSDNISFEIQVEIMNRLPVKSLLQFLSVSKSWKCMIDFSFFVFTYGVHTDLNLSNHKTIGTSEGLWYFSFGNNLLATLWNPSVKKSIGIFVPVFNNIPVCHKIILGFGVPPYTLDPTIVKISYPVSGQGVKKLTIKVKENAIHVSSSSNSKPLDINLNELLSVEALNPDIKLPKPNVYRAISKSTNEKGEPSNTKATSIDFSQPTTNIDPLHKTGHISKQALNVDVNNFVSLRNSFQSLMEDDKFLDTKDRIWKENDIHGTV
ncbi:F-box domain containing protein [Tanacetum coccineum]